MPAIDALGCRSWMACSWSSVLRRRPAGSTVAPRASAAGLDQRARRGQVVAEGCCAPSRQRGNAGGPQRAADAPGVRAWPLRVRRWARATGRSLAARGVTAAPAQGREARRTGRTRASRWRAAMSLLPEHRQAGQRGAVGAPRTHVQARQHLGAIAGVGLQRGSSWVCNWSNWLASRAVVLARLQFVEVRGRAHSSSFQRARRFFTSSSSLRWSAPLLTAELVELGRADEASWPGLMAMAPSCNSKVERTLGIELEPPGCAR